MKSSKILFGAAGAFLLSATATFAAAPEFIPLKAEFKEKSSDIVAPAAKDVPACAVTVAAVADLRRDTRTVGVVEPISVQSPDDTQAWMRAIASGLAARGVTPQFDAPVPSAAAPVVKLGLKSVWITPVNTAFSSDVVMSVDAVAADGRTLKKSYRGQITVINWAGGAGEVQNAITRAFSDALNKMAPDLKALCQPK